MKKIITFLFIIMVLMSSRSNTVAQMSESNNVKSLLSKNYRAICYGGYRTNTRDIQPTILQIKEDLKILKALNIKWVRSYNVHLAETENLLRAIQELKKEDASFEMYLMLGAWMDCKNAWTDREPIHHEESERNEVEIKEAVRLANDFSDIVKVISVGNEAMVKWATKYYVEPPIILKWVAYLQDLKKENKLSKDIWITSSDNFASWGGEANYQNETLAKICQAVDYISIHTYPMHDTHYNPSFWGVHEDEKKLTQAEQIDRLMQRAVDYAKNQYTSVAKYLESIHIDKPIHIGETGWATQCNELYGVSGSQATDEYKQAIYYEKMSQWSEENKLTIFYFEAFDECWKDASNPNGSENHFGLFTIQGEAKYALWKDVDAGKFNHLSRDNIKIKKTYQGNTDKLLNEIQIKYRP